MKIPKVVFIVNVTLVLIEQPVFVPIKMNVWIKLITVIKMHIVLIENQILNAIASMDMKVGTEKA